MNEIEKRDFDIALPLLMKSFEVESDRGVILVISALVERELEMHIGLRLLEKIEKNDEIVSKASFYSKIDLAYRIGLITEPERRCFHELRLLRNKCAHDIDKQDFEKDHFRHHIKKIAEASSNVWDVMQKRIKPSQFGDQAFDTVDEYLDAYGWRPLFEFFFAAIIVHKRVSQGRIPRIHALSAKQL